MEGTYVAFSMKRPSPRPRTKPYTQIGIRRVKCCVKRCGLRGYATWQVCADGRQFRALCWIHDIELNRLALTFVGDPERERKMAKYSAKVIESVTVGTEDSIHHTKRER